MNVAGMKGHILVLATGQVSQGEVSAKFTQLREAVAENGTVSLEQLERLHVARLDQSHFDYVLVGHLEPVTDALTLDQFAALIKVLKPDGRLCLRENIDTDMSNTEGRRSRDTLESVLKLSGFVRLITAKVPQDAQTLIEIRCRKPKYEVGKSRVLSFAKGKKNKTPKAPSESTKQIWAISGDDDLFGDDDDMMDDGGEGLLNEFDISTKTTAPEAETGSKPARKKACKNCSCGRAEMEEEEDTKPATAVTIDGNDDSVQLAQPVAYSACGNCPLGDAFRCSSCPYLGMPAFKPGEQVSLSSRQMEADL